MAEETREFKDFTVDGAIQKGLKEMGLTRETAKIEVKNERTLFKMACVAITPVAAETLDEGSEAEDMVAVNAETSFVAPNVTPEEGALAAGCQTVLTFVEELLKRMNVTAAVSVTAKDGEMLVDISGPDAGGVIGYRGEVLDAVQYFALLIANRNGEKFTRVTVDAEHYRRKREETLTALAHKLEQKAVRTGRKVSLEPMNPFERRIIHTALQDSKTVRTNSEGEGRFRHVVIIPNKGVEGGSQQQMTYGRSNEFRRNGMGKTRSFGDKKKRF